MLAVVTKDATLAFSLPEHGDHREEGWDPISKKCSGS